MKQFLFITLLIAVALVAACSSSDQPRDDRPQVLIIGDSISLGYTPLVIDLMKNRAHVIHCPGNAKHTWNGMVWLDKWLGSTHWDVIQFNHGLHDLAKKPDGSYLSDEGQYKKNLEYIISRLKLTGARLIWATTTPVPNDGSRGRKKGASKRYNGWAAEVLKSHPEIRVTDLYAVAMSDAVSDEWGQGNNVHFNPEDSATLGKAAADGILAAAAAAK